MSQFDSGIWSIQFGAYFLLTCAIVAAIRRVSKKAAQKDDGKLTEIRAQIVALRTKVQLLDEHTNTYFQTLTEAGFPHLQEILRLVESSYMSIEKLTSSGQIEEARILTEWMADQSSVPPLEATLTPAARQALQDWQENSRLLVTACTDALAQTANQNASVGLERSKKRRPTIMNLEKLRQWDNEAQE